MEVVKKLKTHVIFKKKSGRFAVKAKSGAPINGEEKTKILLAEGLIKIDAPKAAPVEESEPEVKEEAEA